MTLIRCPHAPKCRTWINYPTAAEADRALAAHLHDRHETEEAAVGSKSLNRAAQIDAARRAIQAQPDIDTRRETRWQYQDRLAAAARDAVAEIMTVQAAGGER